MKVCYRCKKPLKEIKVPDFDMEVCPECSEKARLSRIRKGFDMGELPEWWEE